MSPTLGELDPAQSRRLLAEHHLGRLTCHGSGGSASVAVTYSMSGRDQVRVLAPALQCAAALAREHASVRLEVDEIDGPSSWSTVIGWGFVEEADATSSVDRYDIRLTAVRGFFRSGGLAAD